MYRAGPFFTTMLLIIALGGVPGALIGALAPTPARAATGDGTVAPAFPDPGQRAALVRRIQESLSRQGFYLGEVDGMFGPETEAAIRAYQKSANLDVNGQVSELLVSNLETEGKVGDLLAHLEQSHKQSMATARQALLSRPETRNLLEGENAVGIQHDSAKCFSRPEPRCLLIEAAIAAEDIEKLEMRSWALGEILTAQARAGLASDAMQTARRIHDPQLIVVALRDIARGQAEAGRFSDALKAVEIIPDIEKQVEAYVAITEIQVERGALDEAGKTAAFLLGRLDELKVPLDDVAIRSRLAVILNHADNRKAAMSSLNAARRSASRIQDFHAREEGLRHVAAAMAELGMPDKALALLRELKNGSSDAPVLMAAATGQALAGASDEALITADAIEAVRYRALVLARIAAFQGGGGDSDQARQTLDKAMDAAAKIQFPYAKAYAFSRISLAYNDVGISGDDDSYFLVQALRVAKLISDDRLRAQILWVITDALGASGSQSFGAALRAAGDATDDIKSPLSRVWMLCDIAEKRAKSGNRDGAWKMYDIAFSEARTITSSWGRSRAIAKVALTLSALADFTAGTTVEN